MKRHIIRAIWVIALAFVIVGCTHAKRQIVVGIAHDGGLSVAGQPCTTAQLSARLAELKAQQPRPVTIHADAGAPFQQVAAVLDACKAAGAKPVTLTTAK